MQWLDVVLRGGVPENRVYLITGDPGTGKTTLGLQFLLEGAANGERGMFVSLSETKAELAAVAEVHEMDLSGIDIFEVVPSDERAKPEQDYSILHPAEVELGESLHKILEAIERSGAKRVVIDSLAEVRFLAREPVRYRRQILALKNFLMEKGCTAFFIDTPPGRGGDGQLETIAHGVIAFERMSPEYGHERRRMQVLKMRGVDFHTGYHDFTIRKGGLIVWPRLVAREHGREYKVEPVPSGLAELDTMLGGGPDRGTTMLIVGGSGTGKSTLAQQYCVTAAGARDEYCAWFAFDERENTIYKRARAMGMDFERLVHQGRLAVETVDPGALSPGELMQRVRRHVEKFGARIVVLDSLNGYLNAMPGERYLMIQMHELLSYLSHMGVLSVLVIAQPGILSGSSEPPLDLSYLADAILLLRYFEHAGQVHKSLAVVKNRGGDHEKTIHEFEMGGAGLRVGPALRQFHGVLTGEPRYIGESAPLMRGEHGGTDR